MKRYALSFLLLIWYDSVPAFPAPPEPVRLVFIAGPNDHCGENPCHRYIEDLTLLKECLVALEGDITFDVTLYVGERPPVGTLDEVAAVVVHSSADRKLGEWHGLFPQNQDSAGYDAEYQQFLEDFDAQIARGMGLMVLHYSTWVDHPTAQARYLEWIGGHYQRGQSRVDGDQSTDGTTAIETVALARPDHPVLRGVTPWTTEAEYYYNLRFRDDDPRFTPLLTSDLPVDDPQTHTIAWCVERADGGRGLGFTGAHSPRNMYLDDFRKFVLNAIAWTARVEVPRGGFTSVVSESANE